MKWLSDRLMHLFHVMSNVKPIVWICIYIGVTPLFALVYWLLPESQFRIPDDNPMDFRACLYYSIVTITTLGFGDYTPTHAWSQGVTACEVMTGLIVLGLFLNAVGAMKSEIDVASAIEKQRLLHFNSENDKLKSSVPYIIHQINSFLTACYYATTPDKEREQTHQYNPDFTEVFLEYKENVVTSAHKLSILLDSVQNRIDITLWPDLLEDFFSFVANEQIFEGSDETQISDFIRKNAEIAIRIESDLTKIALQPA